MCVGRIERIKGCRLRHRVVARLNVARLNVARLNVARLNVARLNVARLNNESEATDVTQRFVSAVDGPSNLHERRNRNRNIGHRELAAHEHIRLERTGA
jgi:hypothetical protein